MIFRRYFSGGDRHAGRRLVFSQSGKLFAALVYNLHLKGQCVYLLELY